MASEYIGRDQIEYEIWGIGPSCEPLAVVRKKDIDEIPAADVEPVVRGRWESLRPNEKVRECMCGTCSACRVRSKYIVNTGRCPNCGARMEVIPDVR